MSSTNKTAVAALALLLPGVRGQAVPPGEWKHDPPLKATHFWDCSGGGCDAATLQPWNEDVYRYAPLYAPLDPSKYGGSMYGERMWMTGAVREHDTPP